MKAQGLPFVVGEFGWQATTMVKYNSRRAMQIFNDLGVGWLAWGWNQMGGRMNMVNDWQYNSAADLTKWGKLVIRDGEVGLKATSVRASIFQSSISGNVFNDTNHNGVLDVGETPLSGVVVYLDMNNSGGLDRKDIAFVTGATGAYTFGRLPVGSYTVRVLPPPGTTTWRSMNTGGMEASFDAVSGKNDDNVNFAFSRVLSSKTAFKGFAAGDSSMTIQAEDFDRGEDGAAFHDLDDVNSGGKYRTGGVDIETTSDAGGGHDVAFAQAGEWLAYTVNVAKDGVFNLDFRVAARSSKGRFHLEVDGKNLTGQLTVPNTGGWQKWRTLSAGPVFVSAGDHEFRIVMDRNGTSGWVGDFNYFAITPSA